MNRFFIILLFVSPTILWGQEKAIPLNISLINEATAIPFTRFITTPLHPGIQLGTEFNYKIKEQSRLFQTANICYFYHNYLAQGIGISSELGYEYRLNNSFAFTGLLGIGYLHTYATSEENTFANGQYARNTDKGNARIYPSLSIDFGYYLKKKETGSPKIFLRYQSWVEYPYSPDFIPVMTHINLHVGIKIFIKAKTNKND
jgi:hypothetical protein